MCALAMAGATVRLAWILTEIDALAAPEAMPYLGFRCPVHEWPSARTVVALEHFAQLDQHHASLDCIRMFTTQQSTASNVLRVHDGDAHCAALVP